MERNLMKYIVNIFIVGLANSLTVVFGIIATVLGIWAIWVVRTQNRRAGKSKYLPLIKGTPAPAGFLQCKSRAENIQIPEEDGGDGLSSSGRRPRWWGEWGGVGAELA